MATESQYYHFAIASTCLEGILITPLVIIWGISFCTVRNKQDPARLPFQWMQITYPLIILDLVCFVAASIASILEIGPFYNDYSLESSYWTLDQIQSRLFDLSNLFENVGNIFLLLCIVDLGLSFLYVPNRSDTGHIIIRGTTACLGVVLFALTVADFAKMEILRTDYHTAMSNSDGSDLWAEPYSLIHLSVAFDIILWIASVAVVALAIYVLIVSYHATRIRIRTILYLVIGILNLLRNTWVLAYDLTWELPKTIPTLPTYVVPILWPILDAWVTFIVLVLLFVSCRKSNSLWTTEQTPTRSFGLVQQLQPNQQHWHSTEYTGAQETGIQY